MPDVSYSYRPRSKKYSKTDTSTVITAGSTTTITVSVGKGFKGGDFNARSVSSVSGGNVAGVQGNLRGSSSSSDYVSTVMAITYSSVYNTLVDTKLSLGMFDSVGTFIELTNAYYEASTGNVCFSFKNTAGVSKTLSVRIQGSVWA